MSIAAGVAAGNDRRVVGARRRDHFDVLAHGEMLPWVIEQLRTRLPQMLPHAKGADLVPKIDHALLDPVIDQVEVIATKAQADVRALRAARDRATEPAG